MSTTAQIAKVIARDNGVCVLNLQGCLIRATVADHRANRGSGGSKTLDAYPVLIAACAPCNGAKEDATGVVLQCLKRRGHRVLKAATNAQTLTRCIGTAVLYADGWHYLRLDGTRAAISDAMAEARMVTV